MKKLLNLLFLVTGVVFAQQIPDNLVKSNYTVTVKDSLKATQSITFLPTTWIKSGATFKATIVDQVYTPINLSNENYVFTRVFQEATTSPTITKNQSVIDQVVYLDGLGRTKQSIAIGQSPSQKDIVTHVEYDDYGRQVEEFLPYAASSATGSIQVGAKVATQTYYKNAYPEDFAGVTDINNITAYSKKELENSPLSRVLKQAAPGQEWRMGSGHEIEMEYGTNKADEVRLFGVSLTLANKVYTPSLTGGTSFYAAGTLTKNVVKDENHSGTASKLHTTEEFKNKQGQVLLKRTYLEAPTADAIVDRFIPHDTYYIYDDYGNLTYVLSPKMNAGTGTLADVKTGLNALGYQYVYDYRNRLVKKKIPGKGWEYVIYDSLDRPVMTQDALQRNKHQWLFTKYDVLGRVVYTGSYQHTTALTQVAMQAHWDATHTAANHNYETRTSTKNALGMFYTNAHFPVSSTKLLTITYYDSYHQVLEGIVLPTQVYSQQVTTRIQGLATVTKTRILDTETLENSYWTTSVTCYDEKARPVYVYAHNNFLQTTDITEMALDFVGKTKKSKTTHQRQGQAAIVSEDVFEYDHAGRLLKQVQQINNQEAETLVTNVYDALGQLKTKKVGGKAQALQSVDYSYNVRGWLRKINEDNKVDNDLFNFEIAYNTNTAGTKLFNGNISQTSWSTLSQDKTKRSYHYNYDALNRIVSATGLGDDKYNVSGISYDKNGNILHLLRKGHTNTNATSFGVMDNLTYAYDEGNKLSKVTDSANKTIGFKDGTQTGADYSYDVNGNMLTDVNKGITSIKYNHLNLPTEVIFNNSNTKKIHYIYDASGVKIQKQVNDQGTVTKHSYIGGYVYKNNEFQFGAQPEGYIKKTNGLFTYVYQYKDHLGNVRLSYTDANKDGVITANSEIVEENNYYPFGLKHKGYNNNVSSLGNSTAQKFGYQKQELTDDLGFDMYEFKYRMHNPSIGRFMQIDPLAEKYVYNGTYNFAENKVIDHIELEGLEGLHHTKTDEHGNKSHVIQKKVIVLFEKLEEVPEVLTTGTRREIRKSQRAHNRAVRRNNNVKSRNQQRLNAIVNDLNNFYGGEHSNSSGEKVTFDFNISTMEVDDATGMSGINGITTPQFLTLNGLESSEKNSKGQNKIVPAMVFTTQPSRGSHGSAGWNRVDAINSGSPPGTISHEMIHVLGLRDNGYTSGGLLNSPPELPKRSEIDMIINASYKGKQE